MATLDLLMITHDRFEYVRKALPALLKNEFTQLTIWDNDSSDERVLDFLLKIKDQRIEVISNIKNDSLAHVTSKVFLASKSDFVGKVDSDTIVPPDWSRRLIDAHQRYH